MAEKNRFSLFGFRLGKKDQDETAPISFTPPNIDDGSITVSSSAFLGTTIDQDGTAKNEVELISRYREMSLQPEIESAIEDIVNEAIVQDDTGDNVKLVMDDLDQPDKIKDAISNEFETVLRLLNFNNMASDLFRRYYIDGRLYFHVIINVDDPGKGILELRYIDPRKIKKVRELKKKKDEVTGVDIITDVSEYYVYNDRISATSAGTSVVGVKIATDSIIYVNSGLMDTRRAMVLSYLHKAIKPLNQLRMIEDASIIYKISRAPQRRIFYVDVGNLPKMKAEQYIRDMMVKYKNKLVYDASTGEVRDDRRHLCLAMDTKVPLLDGRTLTLEQISNEYKEKELWAYSCDPETGKFAPGLITWAGVSVKNAQMMRITLDNGETIDCTPEHKFPVWNNGLTMAKDLVVGDSMVPHYTKEKSIVSGGNSTYEQLFENESKKWEFTHRLVSEWKDKVNLENEWTFNENFSGFDKKTVHHIDYNRYNNSPLNLTRMYRDDHFAYHKQHNKLAGKISGKIQSENKTGMFSLSKEERLYNSKKANEAFRELLKDPEYHKNFCETLSRNNKKWDSEEVRKEHADAQTTEYPIEFFEEIKKCALDNLIIDETVKILNSKLNFTKWKKLNENKNVKNKQFNNLTKNDLYRICKNNGFNGFSELRELLRYNNHKIAKIEYLDERMDAGCLTIDGEEKYHNYHTFALDAGIYTQNSMLEDFWMPRRSDGNRGTEITTLESSDAFNDMSMVEYFEKKLYKSLNVPVTRLNPEQSFNIGRTAEITRDEIKFSKFIDKLRNKFADIFDQALRIQLVLKGICTDQEWSEFKESIFFDFIKDNNFSELKEAELMQQRLGLLAVIDPYVGKYYSKEWIRKNVLRLDDEDIKQIEKQIEQEKVEDFEDQKEEMSKQQELQSMFGGEEDQQEPQTEQPQQQSSTAPINPINPYV